MSSDLEGLIELGGAAAVEAAVMAGHNRQNCPNCGAKFTGPYCANCGQERDTHRSSIGGLLGDFFEDILSFDSRILRTARALVLQPGELSRAFREGRTRAYVPPIRLYFFATLLFFLTLSLSGIAILKLEVTAHTISAKDIAQMQKTITAAREKASKGSGGSTNFNIVIGGTKDLKPGATYPSVHAHFFVPIDTHPAPISPAVQKGIDQMKADFARAKAGMKGQGEQGGFGDWIIDHIIAAMATLARDPTAVNGPLTNWIPRALFLLLPLFAVLTALFHWRQRKDFYFVDHLVFSLNVHSFAFVVLIAAVGLAQFMSNGTMGWLALGAIALYLLLAMKRFYGQSWFWTGVKFAAVSFVYFTFCLMPVLIGVITLSAFET